MAITAEGGIVWFRPELYERAAGGSCLQLMGSRCRVCGRVDFPFRSLCRECLCSDPERFPLSGEGQLYAFTIAHQHGPDFASSYVMGFVDLAEGPRVFAQIAGGPTDLFVGMNVAVQPGRLRQSRSGQEIWGYKFGKQG